MLTIDDIFSIIEVEIAKKYDNILLSLNSFNEPKGLFVFVILRGSLPTKLPFWVSELGDQAAPLSYTNL